MSIQAGQNVTVAYKAQSGLGSSASGSGGTGVRFNEGSAGMDLDRAIIANNESRRDGQSTKGRLGTRRASGSYQQNLSVGTQNDWIAAVLRTTATDSFDLTESDMTSITTTTSTIVAAGGSWLTKGVRKGDKVKLANHSTAGNNNKWLRVLDVSATDITVPTGALILDASPDSSFTLTVAKSFFCGATPQEQYFTIDEYDQDLDLSTLWTDCKVTKMEVSCQPDQNVQVTFTLMGLDGTAEVSGSSPVLTGATYTTTLPLVMSDGTVRINGTDYSVLTGFTLTYDLGGSSPSTLAATAPDVFLDNAKLSGSFSAMKQDLAFFTAARAETTVDFFIDCVEPESDPADFVSFYIGNATLQKASGPMGSTGPRVVTVPWFAGKDEAGGAHESTMLKVSTSV